MNTKKTIYLAIILAFLLGARFSYADSDDTRYLVKSNSGLWKKSFGVRHQFDGGFTTELSGLQVKWAGVFGIEVEPIKKLYVLPDLAQAPLLSGKSKTQRIKPSSQIPWGVKAVYGEELLSNSSGNLGVNVAVLDTGVLKTHPDLKNRIMACKDFSTAAPLVDGKCEDKNGHGTHVAGIIAADGGTDGLGIYGIAPWANILAYKVCSTDGACWADDVAVAIKSAVDHDANIINMSFGSDSSSQLIVEAINYAVSRNVLLIAAAGNDGPYGGSIDYPGADSNVVAVGAIDIDKNISDWSSRGNNFLSESYVVEEKDIELVAPGVNIESTWKDGGYAILSGTSMAAPHVAGLAAKLWNRDTESPASFVREALHKLAHDIISEGDDDSSGFGLPHL